MNCLHCGKPFAGLRVTKKYCSDTCKQYAYLERQRTAGYNPAPAEPARSPVAEHVYGNEKKYLDGTRTDNSEQENYFAMYPQGVITPENSHIFAFVLPRLMCVLDNILMMSKGRLVTNKKMLDLQYIMIAVMDSPFYNKIKSSFPYANELEPIYRNLEKIRGQVIKQPSPGINLPLEKKDLFETMVKRMASICEKRSLEQLSTENY